MEGFSSRTRRRHRSSHRLTNSAADSRSLTHSARWGLFESLCRLQSIDPRHYLTDVLERIISGRTKINQLHMLLPWNGRPSATVRRQSSPPDQFDGRASGTSCASLVSS
ncbi:transposase domain-containing protein (plasmid) [Bradyrhizobium sp. CCGUVB23]|nr:transposase domain-containing protein [Bradyrhizobium sp. CCGUVB23]MCP3468622.1 transposase domain-containing protein [Bradyrhizobium sp. CCGUVB23]